MFYRLLLLFIIVPMIELALLIEVGDRIGFWPTIGLICFTGLVGSSLTRQQGLAVWTQFNGRLQKGELPGTEVIDGLIILIAGALLLTPGILTDIVGFFGLLPVSRKLIRTYAQRRLKNAQASGTMQFNVNIFSREEGAPKAHPTEDTEPQWQGTPRERPED